jgi:dimethylhistidine N-methyltransferase
VGRTLMMLSQRDGLTPVGERLLLYRPPEPVQTASFADDVRAGLSGPRKRLSPKYFYDELGSALFEAICYLPEYYLTRAEAEILATSAGAIVDAVGGPVELVEFGSGSARKTRVLIAELLVRQPRVDYCPVDISASALLDSAMALVAEYPGLHVRAYADDYFNVLSSARLSTSDRVLALFLGSNVGNYEPEQADALLSAMAAAFKPGDGLLLGADLKKPAAVLELAYNDPTGVTAAFNKNLLGRINRELGGGFDLEAFEHSVRYDAERGVVESFLLARRGQTVPIEALEANVHFLAGETIHTESSYKFDRNEIEALAVRNGLRVAHQWTDSLGRFAVSLLVIR